MKLFNVEIITDPTTLEQVYMFSGKLSLQYLQEQSAICIQDDLNQKIGKDFLEALKHALTLEG